MSESYRALNRELHKDPVYGVSGHQWANSLLKFCREMGTHDILDYGCGKRTLEKALGFRIKNYDPCIPGLDGEPEPADIVACIDVLEHIEPECIDNVLAHIASLSKKGCYLMVANRPARKMLPDGRNAHLIQEGPEWWLPKIWAVGLRLVHFQDVRHTKRSIGFLVMCDKEA